MGKVLWCCHDVFGVYPLVALVDLADEILDSFLYGAESQVAQSRSNELEVHLSPDVTRHKTAPIASSFMLA